MPEHSHQSFSPEEKAGVVLRALRGESRGALASELRISPDRIARWESRFIDAGTAALARRRRKRGLPPVIIWAGACALIAALGLLMIRLLG